MSYAEKPLLLQAEDMIGRKYLFDGKEVTIKAVYIERGNVIWVVFEENIKSFTCYFNDFRHYRDTLFRELKKKSPSRAKK